MKHFPHEFEELLSPEGRQLLQGTHAGSAALTREPFYLGAGLLDAKAAAHGARLLNEAFSSILIRYDERLPRPNTSPMLGVDTLPKVGRSLRVLAGGPAREFAEQRGQEIGLSQMVSSESFKRFCTAVIGEPVDGPDIQINCNERHDYVGPHTDHWPDHPRMRDGYFDVHFTFCDPGVREQLLVYSKDRHFNSTASIAVDGAVTAYRLPMWHYTTPMATVGPDDRRWVLISSWVREAA